MKQFMYFILFGEMMILHYKKMSAVRFIYILGNGTPVVET